MYGPVKSVGDLGFNETHNALVIIFLTEKLVMTMTE
jgi:hypothetical protein